MREVLWHNAIYWVPYFMSPEGKPECGSFPLTIHRFPGQSTSDGAAPDELAAVVRTSNSELAVFDPVEMIILLLGQLVKKSFPHRRRANARPVSNNATALLIASIVT